MPEPPPPPRPALEKTSPPRPAFETTPTSDTAWSRGPAPPPVPGDPFAARVVAELTLEERVRLLSGRDAWHLEPVPSAGLPAITVTDGPHGLRLQRGAADQVDLHDAVPATCFPTASALAATWDEDLLTEVGAALGRECRAHDVAVLLGPGANLVRHPAGGRSFEYLSEDPVVAGRLAAALIRGIQSEGVGACLKHLAANHQETSRMTVDTIVDPRTLRELELTAFELAVRGGAPWAVMSAYNRLNGSPCGESRWLLTDLLRDTWGFDGVVVSDWGAVEDRAASIAAGLDLEMPSSGGAFDGEVMEAIGRGDLDVADVDRAATRVVTLIRRAQDNVAFTDAYDADAHHTLARRVAADATVLLTNDGTLPLGAPGRVAVVGAFAETPRLQGGGSSQVVPTRLDDALDAVRDRIGADATLDYARGYDPATGATSGPLVAEAVEVARAADAVLLFVGLPAREESEGFDRDHLRLPDGQHRLVEAVVEANPTTVVVLVGGAPVELPWADRPAALVAAHLGGQAGGSALIDVLFGDAEPGGRLAVSVPVRASDLPADRCFPGHPRQVEHREGHLVGYRFHDTARVPARFPFGHGRSYTTFAYRDVVVSGEGQTGEVAVTVANTGDRAGSEVVQLYVRDISSTLPRPFQELRGFAKVRLDPGASERVTLPLDRRSFAFFDPVADDWCVEGGAFEIVVAASSVDVRARAVIEVPSDDVVRATAAGPSTTGPSAFVATDDEFAAMLGRPVSRPRATLPFHRGSTVADLETTRAGRLVARGIVAAGRRRAATMRGDDDATARMVDTALRTNPLRALALLSGQGPRALRAVDALVDTLNGRWREAVTRGRGRARRGS